MMIANTRKRIQVISTEGSVAERYFEVASEVPRKIVESRISEMPLNGWSARAGALCATGFDSGAGARSSLATTAGFFSGNGNGALSSLAAAAGGGVTAKLGQ